MHIIAWFNSRPQSLRRLLVADSTPGDGDRSVSPGAAMRGALLAAATALAVVPASADTLIDNLDAPGAIAKWTFDLGEEFCCAQGSLTAIPQGWAGSGARLSFTMLGSSRYVAAYRLVSQPNPSTVPAGIAFRVKSPPGIAIQVRVRDNTGQWLQFLLSRPLSALAPSNWYQLGLSFSQKPHAYWDGASDGEIHGPITQIAIIAQPLRSRGKWGQQSGNVLFDEVVWVDSDAESVDPYDAAVLAPGAQDLPQNPGINTEVWDEEQAIQTRLAGFTELSGILQWWKDQEKIKGVYDFHFADTWINWVLQNGISPWFRLQKGNPIYSGTADTSYPPIDADDLQAFANYTRALASRYSGRGVNYSIWNEPNLAGNWKPTANAGQYANLLKAAVPAIRQGDPLAKICAGEIANPDWKYLGDVLAATGPLDVDAICMHAYAKGDVEAFSDDIMLLRDIIARTYGSSGPQLMWTETGYDLNWGPIPGSSESYRKQASTTIRSLLTSWSMGLPVHLFRLRDEGTGGIGPGKQSFGLWNRDWTTTPASDALRVVLDAISGSSFKGTIPTKYRNVHALKFEDTRQVTLILWQDGGSFPWIDQVPETAAKVVVPIQPITVTDFLGNPKTVSIDRTLAVTHEPLIVRFSQDGGQRRSTVDGQ